MTSIHHMTCLVVKGLTTNLYLMEADYYGILKSCQLLTI